MIILDWIQIVIAAIIIIIQTNRGSKDVDLVFFEMLALIISVKLSIQFFRPLATFLMVSPAIVLIFLFIIGSLILLVIVGAITKVVQFSLPPMDTYISFIFGLITSWAVLFIILRILFYAYPSGMSFQVPVIEKRLILYQTLESSEVAQQITDFKAFKSVGSFFNQLRLSQ
jgi:hypothetical protein